MDGFVCASLSLSLSLSPSPRSSSISSCHRSSSLSLSRAGPNQAGLAKPRTSSSPKETNVGEMTTSNGTDQPKERRLSGSRAARGLDQSSTLIESSPAACDDMALAKHSRTLPSASAKKTQTSPRRSGLPSKAPAHREDTVSWNTVILQIFGALKFRCRAIAERSVSF